MVHAHSGDRKHGLTLLARLGFAARGVTYLLVGWFALDAAWRGGRPADNGDAMGTLADLPLGQPLMIAVALGLAGYAFWRLTEAALDPEGIGGGDVGQRIKRLGYAMSGIAHVFLAWQALRIARDAGAASGSGASPGGGGDRQAESWTAWLMEQPAGTLLVGIAGALLFAVAAAQAAKAWKGDFVRDLRGDAPAPDWLCTAGRIGYAARAVVFAVTGWFFVHAAIVADADEAGGMGEALATLQASPGGPWLLAAVAIGLALFGGYSLVEARFRTLRVRVG